MNPTVAPAGNQAPQAPMTAANMGQQVINAANSPELASAASNVQSATSAAQNSQNEDLTLPQMLQQALAPSIANANDPNTQQTKTDLAAELTDLGNPQGIADSAAAAVPGAVLSPSQQRSIIAARLGNEGAALSIDNLISGMRMGGLANVIKAAANAHAQQTQKLLNAATLAQQAYEQALSKAQLHLDATTKAADLMNTLKSLDIQSGQLGLGQQQLAFQQQSNPQYQQQKAYTQASQDVKSMSQQQFYNKWVGSPNLSAQQASAIWNAAHPNQPANFGIQGKAAGTVGGIQSISDLLPFLSNIMGGNNGRPPLSSFNK